MAGTRDLAYLCRQMKAPSLLGGVERLGARAREEARSHEEFLAACLEREVSARASHGGQARIRAARFPARKTLEDFDFDHQRSVRSEVVAHLGALDFIEAKANAIFLGPPGTGKTHLCIAIGVRAALAGYRVAFATAMQWVARLGAAHDAGRLQEELRRLVRTPLIIIDEVGYIPFEPEAAKLFFQLISSRYERASVIVSSNKAFSRWGEVLGDDAVAAAMIDRLVHHAEVIATEERKARLQRVPAAERDRGRHLQPSRAASTRSATIAGERERCLGMKAAMSSHDGRRSRALDGNSQSTRYDGLIDVLLRVAKGPVCGSKYWTGSSWLTILDRRGGRR